MYSENKEGDPLMNKRHEVLFHQLKTYREEIIQFAENTQEEAEIVPVGFRNNIRWNLGHIYLDQYLWIKALTKEEMPHLEPFEKYFGFGTTPDNFDENTPSLHELITILRQQPDDIAEKYGDKLDKEYPPIDMNMHTVEQVLIRTIFHEGMHLQAMMDIKKLL